MALFFLLSHFLKHTALIHVNIKNKAPYAGIIRIRLYTPSLINFPPSCRSFAIMWHNPPLKGAWPSWGCIVLPDNKNPQQLYKNLCVTESGQIRPLGSKEHLLFSQHPLAGAPLCFPFSLYTFLSFCQYYIYQYIGIAHEELFTTTEFAVNSLARFEIRFCSSIRYIISLSASCETASPPSVRALRARSANVVYTL